MSKRDLILDFSEYDVDNVIADIEEIRQGNPQRYEMEQLTAICLDDPDRHVCVGYKDLGPDDFWVRGHMPDVPLMPGVIMCEAAAQLASYHTRKHGLLQGNMVGLGGLEKVRFRGVVRPGDRFVIVLRLLKVRSTILTCEFQCFVRQNLVCEGIIKGVALPKNLLVAGQSR